MRSHTANLPLQTRLVQYKKTSAFSLSNAYILNTIYELRTEIFQSKVNIPNDKIKKK